MKAHEDVVQVVTGDESLCSSQPGESGSKVVGLSSAQERIADVSSSRLVCNGASSAGRRVSRARRYAVTCTRRSLPRMTLFGLTDGLLRPSREEEQSDVERGCPGGAEGRL